MLWRAWAFVPSSQSLHCSRKYTKWAFIRYILSANAQTCLSVCAVLPELLLLSHMRKMGVHTAYSFSKYSDETKYSCSLARAITALTHAQNGRTYGIFHQSMLWRAWAFVPSSQSLHWSRTYTKWAFIWHILSANAQTCLSVCAVLQEPELLSHMHKMGVHMAYFFQSMLSRELVCMQSCQSLHCSRTCTKLVCLWHLLSVNAQTSLSMRAVSPEPSLLSHIHKISVHTAYSFSQCSDET